jgi:hypothetical protein
LNADDKIKMGERAVVGYLKFQFWFDLHENSPLKSNRKKAG